MKKVAWNQLVFYFTTTTEARSILLYVGIDLFKKYFPLGAGLATFGTAAAQKYYSPVYGIYGLSNRHGFTFDNPLYLTDNFYVHFRDKSFGYAAPNVKIVFKDGSSAEQTFLIKSYMKTFMSGLNVRPSCSECAFKGIDRCSDLTFGDCWHIGVFQKAMDDNLGTTSVYVHSPKGSMLLDMIKNQVNISQIDTQQEIKLDGRKINESVQKNPNSIIFFNDARTLPYDVLVKKWVPDSKKEMLVTIIKRHAKNLPFFKKMIKKVRS